MCEIPDGSFEIVFEHEFDIRDGKVEVLPFNTKKVPDF
jgi:hypothetical protein